MVHVVDLPLVTGFRGLTRRQAVVWEGPCGWAEWSPFVEYDDAEAAMWLRAAHEMAEQTYPQPVRDRVPVNVIVPASLGPEAGAQRVRDSGCTTAKVKVAATGESLENDIARVAAVREVLGPEGRIRVDANAAWTVAEAAEALAELSQFELEYAEQPVVSVEELRELRTLLTRRGIEAPLAADESIRRAKDPLAVREVADVAIVKVQPLGGVRRALDLAEALRLPVVVSSALDTSVGLRAGLALAAALPELPYACGLQTATLFERDVTTEPLVPIDGMLEVREVVPDNLAQVAADESARAWWLERLRRVEGLL